MNDEKDLEIILTYTANVWAGGSLAYLFKSVIRKNESISAFDFQILPDLDKLLAQCDPGQSYQCKMVIGETVKRDNGLAPVQLDLSVA